MLEIGARKVADEGLAGRISLLACDAAALPFADGTFDAALCAFGFRNFPDIPSSLSEAARILRDGGQLAVLEFFRPRSALLGAFTSGWLKCLSSLFAADRAVHTRQIEEILDSGRWVICDRYLGSTVAYQSASFGESADWDWLLGMQKKSVITPDLTILLDIDPEVSMARVSRRGEELSRFEKLDFLRKVRSAYLRLADILDYQVVDAAGDEKQVAETVLEIMRKKGLYAPQ
jgi:dTMP kinase